MKLLSFEEAGGILSTPPDTVRLWYRMGLLPHYRIGRRVLFAVEDLHAFLNARRVDATSGEAAVVDHAKKAGETDGDRT